MPGHRRSARRLGWIVAGFALQFTQGTFYAMALDVGDARLAALAARFADTAEFTKLCDRCRQRNIEMDQRSRALEHTETQHTLEVDKQGQTVSDEKGVERVWFVGDDEFRQTLVKQDALSGKAKKFDPKPRKSPKADTIYPFTQQERPGMYRYEFDQAETVDDRALVRVKFEPAGPPDGLMRGVAWLDPETSQCLRFDGEVVKLPRFVSEIRMTLSFGPAENGDIQTRHSVVQTGGGVGLIQKRFRIETVLSEYRVRGETP